MSHSTNHGTLAAMRMRVFPALVLMLLVGSASNAQQVVPRFSAGWGTNFLTSPGTDLVTAPGRSGYLGAGLSVGGKVRFEPDFLFTGNTYRTRMAYKVYAAATRISFRADLLVGFPQMNKATLRVGPFIGIIRRSDVNLVQGDQNTFFGNYNIASLKMGHRAESMEAGVALGYAFPVSNDGRFQLEFQLRQHIIPLVEQDQYFALQFSPEQLVFSTNTRPTVISLGGVFLLKGKSDQKGKKTGISSAATIQ